MRVVVLFGGGDGGGLIITEHGVRPIPPFDPTLRLSLKSAAAIVNAAARERDEHIRTRMAKLATEACNLVVGQVEGVLGLLDPDRSLIFQDDDGGFVCGSTGKPPIPLPWPPQPIPSVQDLLRVGVIDQDLIDFLQRARANKVPWIDVFEKPEKVAQKLSVSLSEKSVNDLKVLAPSRLENIQDPTDKEIVAFFHKVIKNGRHVEDWFSHPYEVSQALKVKLSENALERLVGGGGVSIFPGKGGGMVADFGLSITVIAVADAVIIAAIALSTSVTPVEIVRDRSGLQKF